MKIIFLDIDGVLNSDDWYRSKEYQSIVLESYYKQYDIDPRALDRLIKLLNETGAKVVISSSWRGWDLDETHRLYDNSALTHLMPYVVGVTPGYLERRRGREIQDVLENRKTNHILWQIEYPIESYVIFDDDCDMLDEQKPNFVQTSWWHGLTENDCEKAKQILNEKK